MARLWRLTRNRYGRAAYEALAAAGVTATVMYEYVATLEGTAGTTDDRDVRVCDPNAVAALAAPNGELVEGEEVIAAFADGTPSGYLFLSVDATHEIHPLERELTFEGAYVRRVFVDPAHRNDGVATAMLRVAMARARERGADRATALVALDNAPSRALFERQGFHPERKRRYARVGPLSHRSVVPA